MYVVLSPYTRYFTHFTLSFATHGIYMYTCQAWNASSHCGAKWVAGRVLMTPMLLVIECGMVRYMSVLPMGFSTILANVYCFTIVS